jgi:hypothetical protein
LSIDGSVTKDIVTVSGTGNNISFSQGQTLTVDCLANSSVDVDSKQFYGNANGGEVEITDTSNGVEYSNPVCTTTYYYAPIDPLTGEADFDNEFSSPSIINDDDSTLEYETTDPLLLNLQGGKVQTTSLNGSGTYFDMQNNGQQVQTGWATAGEGFLVYDPNNTNTVTDEANLVTGFGELNLLAQSVDGTNSGTLTSSDALWDSLKVWVDTSGTGNFQSGQLETLDQLGITSINLDAAAENQDSNENTIVADSSFTFANGCTGDIAGVSLAFNPNAVLNQPSTPNAAASNSLDSLISAMAAFAPPTAGQTSLLAANSATYQAPLLAANPG